MFIIQIILIALIVASVNCANCSYTSWSESFNSIGQSKCQENNYYIRGLERNDVNWIDDPIIRFGSPRTSDRLLNQRDDQLDHLEGVECCGWPPQWSNNDMQVVYDDWTYVLETDNTWATCPQGYFLQGLYRSDTGWPSHRGYLHNLETARCAKPIAHPFFYGSCYDEDITACLDKKGRCSCKEGHYVTGLYRAKGDNLMNLDSLRCCTMADKPQVVDNAEDLKDRIMDTTLWKMANLADMLGYGYCYGNRGVNVGEDFERNEDTWEASKKLFWHQSNCEGVKCDQRLNLAFGDWRLVVNDIKYGKIVTDDLKPETVDSGTIYNSESTPVTETFSISKTTQETITHSTTSSWSNSHELGISLNFDIPKVGSATVSYSTKYEFSSSTTKEKSTQNSRTFTKTTSKTLQPFSSATYKVVVSKSRTTIPYTAVISTRFSTEFRGFMKYTDGVSGPTNYHYLYKGNKDRPTFNYKFGSQSVPFYTALKKESESLSKPWLWNEIFSKYPTARQIINSLTNETQYEFTLSGFLEQVSGTKIDVFWETVNRTRREAPDRNTMEVHISNETILAVRGPNDPPAKVENPDLYLGNSIQ